jgi:hypothetical protein
MYQQAEFTDRLKLISADNARCNADIAALKKPTQVFKGDLSRYNQRN